MIPAAADRIAEVGLKSVLSAGRAALGEIVEEGLGIPVLGKRRFVSRSGGEIPEGATWHDVKVVSERSPIIISENMERLQKYADKVNGKTINDFVPSNQWSKEANKKWIRQMKQEGR